MTLKTHMDQRIFEWGLPVETVSLYLLCTGLADTDTALTLTTIRSKWNGDDDTLTQALHQLQEKCILCPCVSDQECFDLGPADGWKS